MDDVASENVDDGPIESRGGSAPNVEPLGLVADDVEPLGPMAGDDEPAAKTADCESRTDDGPPKDAGGRVDDGEETVRVVLADGYASAGEAFGADDADLQTQTVDGGRPKNVRDGDAIDGSEKDVCDTGGIENETSTPVSEVNAAAVETQNAVVNTTAGTLDALECNQSIKLDAKGKTPLATFNKCKYINCVYLCFCCRVVER